MAKIATDTNAIGDYLRNLPSREASLVEDAIRRDELVLPPVVVTELLSARGDLSSIAAAIATLAKLPITDGFWERAAASRRLAMKQGHKTRTADALIAQACIDAGVPLITRDADFQAYAKFCGLKLA